MGRTPTDRGALRLGLVAAAVGLLVAAAAAGALLARPRSTEPKLHHAVIPLGTLVVNLEPSDGFRYLKVTLALRVRTPLAGERLKEAASEEKFRWQDTVVRHLTGQRYSDIRSLQGRRRLERELVERLNGEESREFHVEGVYFSEFVAQ
ncbi:MAG: flagellar basal body-associated FliL family protein [Armatimonadota bacterium]|nr:flagellar basal body-associated FliL family protein [Armatimonadota bacterium]MDR5675698.1 flagellar basal body-associated FliL family protein [Armatimonadota bacterium]MDR5689451.1 flagellar basal body-associated FliL family protein [Armatimonadota bacterium]MDR7399078.1 flagellar basal body-associated FliL family protein [Armatimonadota bacterium]MDR7429743.1 flagellar basal body-associated FliL family protein [Armatimonadota bacterium]